MTKERWTDERADLEKIVQKGAAFRKVIESLEEAYLLAEEDDAEMSALAKGEIAELEPQRVKLELEIKSLLLPKDPRDGRNVIVEIRAGTGGDEAGLFGADLYRMYSRYAERQRWKTEIMSQSDTGVGGLKEITFLIKGQAAGCVQDG